MPVNDFEEIAPRLSGYARRWTSRYMKGPMFGDTCVRDIAQEAILRLLIYKSPVGSVNDILKTLAFRAFRERYRSHERRQHAEVESYRLTRRPPTPEMLVLRRERSRIITRALNESLEAIGPKYRRVIKSRYFAELSHDEIAVEMSIGKHAAKCMISTGLGKLRALMLERRDVLQLIEPNRKERRIWQRKPYPPPR